MEHHIARSEKHTCEISQRRDERMCEDNVLTMMVIANGAISLVVLYLVAPLYDLKGRLAMLINTIKSHDRRIQSIEDKV